MKYYWLWGLCGVLISLFGCKGSLEKKGMEEVLPQRQIEIPPKGKEGKKEEVWNEERVSFQLANILCQRVLGCGRQWEDGTCLESMGKDILSLLKSRNETPTPEETQACIDAMKQANCSTMAAFRLPKECEMIK